MTRRALRVVAAITFLALFPGCESSSERTHAVYSDLLAQIEVPTSHRRGVVPTEILLLDMSMVWPGDDWSAYVDGVCHTFPGLRADTLVDFKRANASPVPLRGVTTARWRIVPLTQTALIEAIRTMRGRGTEPYDGVYARYPDAAGVLTLSQVGFSSDGRQALVFYGLHSSADVGRGFAVLLEWAPGSWTIVGTAEGYIS